jgi:hypothetical protein
MFHILLFMKTRIHHTSTDVHKFIDSWKYSFVSIHDGHGLMMMYDIHMHLDSFNVTTSNGLEYIATSFNTNIQNQYILYIYIEFIHVQFLHSQKTSKYNWIITRTLPNLVLGDFYVNILKDNNH